MERYNALRPYLRSRFGCEVRKICIDGGFTCPNRDGKAGRGGCIFCGGRGAGEHIDPAKSIREQVEAALAKAERRPTRYIVYFQNFTNTYAPVYTLRERYDAALIGDPRICALAIGTRPDCLGDDVVRLLSSYRERLPVICELGLQTASDVTAERINRGYKTSVFVSAVRRLAAAGIEPVVHLIAGLPGEGEAEFLDTVRLLNTLPVAGVKLHSLYVMEGTQLADMYRSGGFSPISEEEYVACAAHAIAALRSDIIIHRLTGDCPPGLLVAPEWNADKSRVIEKIRKKLAEENITQGCRA